MFDSVYQFAIKIGFDPIVAKDLIERFKDEETVDIEDCVTPGIYDDLTENAIQDFIGMSEVSYYSELFDYFYDLDPRGFCSSVQHKVLFGHYLAVKGLIEVHQ
jgi:hypothetical protein